MSRLRLALLGGLLAAGWPLVSSEGVYAQRGRPVPATLAAVVSCAHEALGGATVVNAVKALRWTSETGPAPGVTGPVPSQHEMAFVLPDRYKSAATSATLPGGVVGFNAGTLLTSMGGRSMPGDPGPALALARGQFARHLLMLLVRISAIVPATLSFRGIEADGDQQRLAVHAVGPDGFNATLLLDPQTCQPAALTYVRPANLADLRREQAPGTTGRGSAGAFSAFMPAPGEMRTVRVDLTDHRSFGGLRFPTVLKTSIGGRANSEERVTSVHVNPAMPPDYFARTPY